LPWGHILEKSENGYIASYKVKKLLEKWGYRTKVRWNMTICNSIINKHRNIWVGVDWNDISVPG